VWSIPANATISWGAFKVHNIGIRRVKREGVNPQQQLRFFHDACTALLQNGCRVVAHNAAFDHRMLVQTARRYDVPWTLESTDYFCTMQKARPLVNMRNAKGRSKAPSNVELYEHLLHKKPTGSLHDARVDVAVTASSFAAGAKRGWWSLGRPVPTSTMGQFVTVYR
jgi:DNA polymerase III epsilon subunit-like protein